MSMLSSAGHSLRKGMDAGASLWGARAGNKGQNELAVHAEGYHFSGADQRAQGRNTGDTGRAVHVQGTHGQKHV